MIIIASVVIAALYIPLIFLDDCDGRLTAMILTVSQDKHYFYARIANKEYCKDELKDYDNFESLCDLLYDAVIPNTVLNIGMSLALLLCFVTITVAYFQLKGWYFRMTNFLILDSGILFLVITGVWYVIVLYDTSLSDKLDYSIRYGDIVIPLCGVVELFNFFISRQFTLKLYDAKFMDRLLENSTDDDSQES